MLSPEAIGFAEWVLKTYGIPGAAIFYLGWQNYVKDRRIIDLTDQLLLKTDNFAARSIERDASNEKLLERVIDLARRLQ